MARAVRSVSEVMGSLAKEIPALSSGAKDFLRRRPRDARMAVAVALEAAAAQYNAEDAVPGSVPERLAPFIVARSAGQDMLGVTGAATRLQVSRTTVYDWVGRRTLLAWKSTRRGLTIPAEQILGPGKVVDGLAGVLDVIDDPELAWAFLTQEWPFEDEAAFPLEMLKAGRIQEVIDAAPGFGAAFS